MTLSNLKKYLNNKNIILYDQQYRIINHFIDKKHKTIKYTQHGGDPNYNKYKNLLGSNNTDVNFNINKIFKN